MQSGKQPDDGHGGRAPSSLLGGGASPLSSATSTTSSSSSAFPPDAFIAKPVVLSDAQVKAQYPSHLQLQCVQVVHRHGERTPLVPDLLDLVNPVHHLCHWGSFITMIPSSALTTTTLLPPSPSSASASSSSSSSSPPTTTAAAMGSSIPSAVGEGGGGGRFNPSSSTTTTTTTTTTSPKGAAAAAQVAAEEAEAVVVVPTRPVPAYQRAYYNTARWSAPSSSTAAAAAAAPALDASSDAAAPRDAFGHLSDPQAGICYHGQLTDQGRLTMHRLGKHLRSLYVDRLRFLPHKLDDPSLLFLRSSDYPRTLESLHSVTDGIYPLQHRSPALHAQPLHIFTRTPSGNDNIFPDFGCARYKALRKQFDAVMKQQSYAAMEKWPTAWKALLGPKKDPVLPFDVLASAIVHGEPVNVAPAAVQAFHDEATRVWFEPMTAYPTFPRLMIGRFVTELQELMEHHIRGAPPPPTSPVPSPAVDRPESNRAPLPPHEFTMHYQLMRQHNATTPPRLAIYSAHDSTIAPLLEAVGAWNHKWPEFASHLTFELFKDITSKPDMAPEDRHFVRMRHNDRTLALAGCQSQGDHDPSDPSLCRYRAFKTILQRHATTRQQHHVECEVVRPTS